MIRPTAVFAMVFCMVMVVSAVAQTEFSAADQKELFSCVLTMDKVQRISDATEALQPVRKQHPELSSLSGAKSLSEAAKTIQKYPDAVAILAKNGLKPREYVVGLIEAMQARLIVGLKKQGTFKDYPPDLLKLVSKTDLDFAEEHWDAIRAIEKTKVVEKPQPASPGALPRDVGYTPPSPTAP